MKPRRLSFATAAFALLLAAVSPALAAPGTSIGFENGGKFVRFDPVVDEYNRTGEPFRIVGLCQSACTLFLSIRNVCVEPHASFGFHSANDGNGNKSEWGNNRLLNAYNPKLRRHVLDNNYLANFDFHYISGRDIIEKFGYPACTPKHRFNQADRGLDRDNYGNRGFDRDRTMTMDNYGNRGFDPDRMNNRGNSGTTYVAPRRMEYSSRRTDEYVQNRMMDSPKAY